MNKLIELRKLVAGREYDIEHGHAFDPDETAELAYAVPELLDRIKDLEDIAMILAGTGIHAHWDDKEDFTLTVKVGAIRDARELLKYDWQEVGLRRVKKLYK